MVKEIPETENHWMGVLENTLADFPLMAKFSKTLDKRLRRANQRAILSDVTSKDFKPMQKEATDIENPFWVWMRLSRVVATG